MRDLRCYAYWDIIDGIQCRYGTLLVGNNNERLIGNCIMKNPGSANPIDSLFVREDGRKEFTVDATMRAIAELFDINKNGGTVRIWNLSDVREPDFTKAQKTIKQVDDIREFNNTVPTYIGWGDFWKNPTVNDKAKSFFKLVQPQNTYLNKDIEKNPFFHPLYLLRYAKNKNECVTLYSSFASDKSH